VSSPAKRVAIVQSSYLPWKGYFDLIGSVDEFILLDDAQFTKRDWRNRNRIKTPQGLLWLTVPVRVKGALHQRIDEVKVVSGEWADRHWQTIRHCYSRSESFEKYRGPLEKAFRFAASLDRLVDINRFFLAACCEWLGVTTPLVCSGRYGAPGGRTERLVELCRRAGATEYWSGPSARAYLNEGLFERAGVRVKYIEYAGYPPYRQLHGEFLHEVSVIDLILNEGLRARSLLKSPLPVSP
jgi:hypothetical protein